MLTGGEEDSQMYHDVLSAIDQEGLTANISIKPTALGLRISYELCLENLMTLLAQGCFVRLDMEDSTSTDPTLRLYREFRERGYSRLGSSCSRVFDGRSTTFEISPTSNRTSVSARAYTSSLARSPTPTRKTSAKASFDAWMHCSPRTRASQWRPTTSA